MKYLLMFLLAILVGCDSEEPTVQRVKQEDLQFKASDIVLIHEPFYENCYGAVIDYNTHKMSNKPVTYKVSIVCRLGPLGKVVDIPETDMQLRVRSELRIEEPQQAPQDQDQ
jgi:hypothetical protein